MALNVLQSEHQPLTVDRITRRVVRVLALGNLTIGLLLFFGAGFFPENPNYSIVSQILPLKYWGLLFFSVGLIQVFSILRLSHRDQTLGLSAGASLATIWTLGFIFELLTVKLGSLGAPVTWGLFAWLQWFFSAAVVRSKE